MKIVNHLLLKRSFVPALFLFSTILPLELKAAVQKWEILKDKSNVTFTATQNNSPVTGEFKAISGEINFDANQLSLSNVNIIIDMNSVTTSYAEIATTLKTPEWFDVKTYPKATFKATSFNKVGENSYQATGLLTLRNKSSTITLPFELKQITPITTEAKGEVEINFTLTATKK